MHSLPPEQIDLTHVSTCPAKDLDLLDVLACVGEAEAHKVASKLLFGAREESLLSAHSMHKESAKIY